MAKYDRLKRREEEISKKELRGLEAIVADYSWTTEFSTSVPVECCGYTEFGPKNARPCKGCPGLVSYPRFWSGTIEEAASEPLSEEMMVDTLKAIKKKPRIYPGPPKKESIGEVVKVVWTMKDIPF